MSQDYHGKTQGPLLRSVLAKLDGVRDSGDGYAALCPAHADTSPSLSISESDDGHVLLHCHASCNLDAILEALGMEESDLFRRGLNSRSPGERRQYRMRKESQARAKNKDIWKDTAERHQQAVAGRPLDRLIEHLGIHSPTALQALGAGWDNINGCWTFPERDGQGQVIGLSRRYSEGRKSFEQSGHRGLYIPDGFASRPGPVLIVEGASDTAACHAEGLAVVGRPSATGGVEHLVELLKDDKREIVVVGEWDQKPDGSWPGKDGAVKVANELGNRLHREVKWVLPPEGSKDLRAWLQKSKKERPDAQ